ncbi:MAG: hypothetical protein K5868_03425 [Lachnospiraceae bacterium]|nr:hypothetical protein [Lachnospiraceae bacterium]
MKIRKIIKIFTASLLAGCLALSIPGMASKASTPGQAQDSSEVKYGTVSKTDQKLIRNLFDAEFYASENPDVAGVVGTNPDRLWTHFIKHGIFEARTCNAAFNVSVYKSSYPDLQRAFKNDVVAYYRHYLKHGIEEERNCTTVDTALRNGKTVCAFWSGQVVAKPSGEPAVKTPTVDETSYSPAPAKPAPTDEEKAAAERAAQEAVEKARKEAEEKARQEAEAEAARIKAEEERQAAEARAAIDKKIQEETERARREAERKAKEEAEKNKAPEAKEGYKVITADVPLSASVNVYGNKNGGWNVVNTYDLYFEYDEYGRKLSERYKDGNYYRKYEYDANGNLTRELWNINNLFDGYDGYEYTYNDKGYAASRKTWSQGKLTEWLEYAYTYTASGLPDVAAVSRVDYDADDFTRKDVKLIGYSDYFYNEYDVLIQQSFSDDTRYDWELNNNGSPRLRIKYAGDSFVNELRYEYNDAGKVAKEISYLPAGKALKVDEEKTYVYGTVYVQVPE